MQRYQQAGSRINPDWLLAHNDRASSDNPNQMREHKAIMNPGAISRYPVPKLDDLPEDIRTRILEVQEKAGFIPNVFLTLAHRPDEFRAFLI